MVEAYSVFANNGTKIPLSFIKRIEDNNNNIIEQTKISESKNFYLLKPVKTIK